MNSYSKIFGLHSHAVRSTNTAKWLRLFPKKCKGYASAISIAQIL